MKKFLLLILVIAVVGGFSSCASSKVCPAYSSGINKKKNVKSYYKKSYNGRSGIYGKKFR